MCAGTYVSMFSSCDSLSPKLGRDARYNAIGHATRFCFVFDSKLPHRWREKFQTLSNAFYSSVLRCPGQSFIIAFLTAFFFQWLILSPSASVFKPRLIVTEHFLRESTPHFPDSFLCVFVSLFLFVVVLLAPLLLRLANAHVC